MIHSSLTACTCNQQRKIDKKLVGHATQIVDFLIASCVPAIKVANHDFAALLRNGFLKLPEISVSPKVRQPYDV